MSPRLLRAFLLYVQVVFRFVACGDVVCVTCLLLIVFRGCACHMRTVCRGRDARLSEGYNYTTARAAHLAFSQWASRGEAPVPAPPPVAVVCCSVGVCGATFTSRRSILRHARAHELGLVCCMRIAPASSGVLIFWPSTRRLILRDRGSVRSASVAVCSVDGVPCAATSC